MTVIPPEYADDMPATEAQVDSLKEDFRALSDTVSEILTTVNDRFDSLKEDIRVLSDTTSGILTIVNDHTTRLDAMDTRFDAMDTRFDAMDREFADLKGTVQKILTPVERNS